MKPFYLLDHIQPLQKISKNEKKWVVYNFLLLKIKIYLW